MVRKDGVVIGGLWFDKACTIIRISFLFPPMFISPLLPFYLIDKTGDANSDEYRVDNPIDWNCYKALDDTLYIVGKIHEALTKFEEPSTEKIQNITCVIFDYQENTDG